MLFKIQQCIGYITPDLVQPNDQRTREIPISTPDSGHKRRMQVFILALPATGVGCQHLPPATTLQGFREFASLTPHLQDLQQPVHSFNWRSGCFYPVLSDIAAFQQGKLQSNEDFYPYIGRRRSKVNNKQESKLEVTKKSTTPQPLSKKVENSKGICDCDSFQTSKPSCFNIVSLTSSLVVKILTALVSIIQYI